MHELSVGKTPFTGNDLETIYENISKNKVKFGTVSQDCLSLLRKLLEVEKKRLSTAQEVKQHAWFSGMNWEALYAKTEIPPFIPYLMPIVAKQDDIAELDALILEYSAKSKEITSSFNDF